MLAIVFIIATSLVIEKALSTITILVSASNVATTTPGGVSNLAITISISASNLVVAQTSFDFIIRNKVIMHDNCVKIKFVANEFLSL